MTIEQLDETRVLIALGKDDMHILSLEYSTMGFKDPYSRRVLKKLLALAGAKTGLTVSNRTVMVEALPYDKGCLLVLTLVPKENGPKKYRIKRSQTSTMYCFENSEALLGACEQLYLGGFLLTGSIVWEHKNKYYLIVKPSIAIAEKALFTLREYALVETTKKTEIAKITEHGNIVAESHAILHIGHAMCK